MAVRRVIQIGDPRLKKKNEAIVDFNDKMKKFKIKLKRFK